jgi:cell division control protein 7
VWLARRRTTLQLPPDASSADRERAELLSQDLAIKRFLVIHDSDRITTELAIAFRYGHLESHILPVLDIQIHPGLPVSMVMPYRKHQEFKEERLKKMNVRQVQSYMRGLLTALQHLHQFNVVHRDGL